MADNRERNGYENLQHMRKQKEIDTKVESGMKNFVITIGREFGSGGHNLGKSLAKELGIPCYDRHLIEEAAVCGGFKMEELEEADEMKANRFLFKVPAKCNPFTGYGKPMNDTLFVVQSQLIREYAKKGPCIIVGRCADKILAGSAGSQFVFSNGRRAPSSAPAFSSSGSTSTNLREEAEENWMASKWAMSRSSSSRTAGSVSSSKRRR